jgi:hypothetical protein
MIDIDIAEDVGIYNYDILRRSVVYPKIKITFWLLPTTNDAGYQLEELGLWKWNAEIITLLRKKRLYGCFLCRICCYARQWDSSYKPVIIPVAGGSQVPIIRKPVK